MRQHFLHFCITLCLFSVSSQSNALSDTYYSTGEDLDYLIESDNMLAIQELEYELRKFVLFRKVEDYIFNFSVEYFDDEY